MRNIVDQARNYFLQTIEEASHDKYGLLHHVPQMELWAKKILPKYPDADRKVVLAAVWLHDISHYELSDLSDDHAIRGENKARKFLARENVPSGLTEGILHCVRSHRCRDIKPKTIEAKIIAAIDSASHMTDTIYPEMMNRNPSDYVIAKMARDYRDIALIPEVKEIAEPFYHFWKEFLREYQKFIAE